jgi:2-oxo-4-hydroxy-4-carboxy-5-ureidoimidazoline decarboxylase
VTTLTLDALNRMDRAEFTRALGAVFENSRWIAERAWASRPFASVDALHGAMMRVARAAPRPAQLSLLRAHPDLAGQAARAGTMTPASVDEQASAGLDRLSEETYERFSHLNAAYREKFNFPFIVAVRRHDVAGILTAFEKRIGHSADEEVEVALVQVGEITRMRLDRLVREP